MTDQFPLDGRAILVYICTFQFCKLLKGEEKKIKTLKNDNTWSSWSRTTESLLTWWMDVALDQTP